MRDKREGFVELPLMLFFNDELIYLWVFVFVNQDSIYWHLMVKFSNLIIFSYMSICLVGSSLAKMRAKL